MRSRPYLPPAIYALALLASALMPGLWAEYALPLGFLFLAFAFGVFLERSRRYFPLIDLLFLHAVVYLWLAPAISYALAPQLHPGANFMPVEAPRYFALAIPGTLALLMGGSLALAVWQRPEGRALEQVEAVLRSRPWLPFALVALGLAGQALYPLAPAGLRAVAYFVYWMSLTGSFYLLFLDKKWKWVALAALYLLYLRWSLGSTQAGLPLWTLVFAAMLLFLRHRTRPWIQGLAFGGAFVLVLLAMQVKFEYRTAMRKAGMPKELSAQAAILSGVFLQGDTAFFSPRRWTRTLDRFNQGYHIGMAMRHTPSAEPYARGETIWRAVAAAFVPRALWPDKPRAGGHGMYERFAGQKLSYSANLGPLGEAYVNFGMRGAVGVMFAYGFAICAAFAWLGRLSLWRWPALLLWLPFIFSALLTLETDFATVLNHLVKGSMFALAAIWGGERLSSIVYRLQNDHRKR